jgi:HSP20 family molecular chaperone IbpA
MSEDTRIQKHESENVDTVERTRSQRVFVPRVDIFENDDAILLYADMPGVDEKSIDITLEKNILTIEGCVCDETMEGYELSYMEYDVGDYRRSFTLSDVIDRDKIEATVRNGVLKLTLPKAEPAKARKINVVSG